MMAVDILINKTDHSNKHLDHGKLIKAFYINTIGSYLFTFSFFFYNPESIFCLSDDTESGRHNQSPAGQQNGGAQLHQVSDVKTLEYLVRIYVMLAELVGRKSSHFTEYCLFAVACVQRMWKVLTHYFVVPYRS